MGVQISRSISNGRKKKLYEKIKKYLGPMFHELAGQKECRILDHVHMLMRIPPKYAVSIMSFEENARENINNQERLDRDIET